LIVRVLQGHVLAEHLREFRDEARHLTSLEFKPDGLVSSHVGRQVHSDGSEQIIFVTVWRDLEAVYRWVGGRDLLETPVLAARPDVFKSFDVQHYEVVEFPNSAGFTESQAGPEPLAAGDPMPAVMGTSI
jgi:heme-degrading monooxygenase HmoA